MFFRIISQLQLIKVDQFALLCVFVASVLNVQILSDTDCDFDVLLTMHLSIILVMVSKTSKFVMQNKQSKYINTRTPR